MTKQKTPVPVDSLFDQGYKLSYFCKGLSKYVPETLITWYKKDVFHIFTYEFKEKYIESGLFTLKRIPGTYWSF